MNATLCSQLMQLSTKKTTEKKLVHENFAATNLSLAKHCKAEGKKLVHSTCENTPGKDKQLHITQRNILKRDQPKHSQDMQEIAPHTPLQTVESPEELYSAIRKKTKESTAWNEEELPPLSPQGGEQLYTAVNKKTQLTIANDDVESPPIPPHTVEQLYTAVMKKPKARVTDDEVEAPPVPPHTVEELYTAVQKNKN